MIIQNQKSKKNTNAKSLGDILLQKSLRIQDKAPSGYSRRDDEELGN
jgi:hypothetical protein